MMHAVRLALFLPVCAICVALLSGCKDSYRIGEYVWVEWEGRQYPAYIVDRKAKAKFRIHFDGYDVRWDEDVTADRIKGRVDGVVTAPPPPERVAEAMGLRPKPSGSASAPMGYNVGDRLRVRWRDSVYAATVLSVPRPGQFTVHYEGYGSEWDEAIGEDRIVNKR